MQNYETLQGNRLQLNPTIKKYLPPSPKIYYPGMGVDLYTPFVVFQSDNVIGVDCCYFFKKDNEMDDNKMKERFMSFVIELKKEFHALNFIMNEIEIDYENYYISMEFTYEGRVCNLEYHYFTMIEDFIPPSDVDLILTKGVEIFWNDFEPEIKQGWIDTDAYIMASQPKFSNKLKQLKGELNILEPVYFHDLERLDYFFNQVNVDRKELERTKKKVIDANLHLGGSLYIYRFKK